MKYLFYSLLLVILCGLWAGLGPLIKIAGQVPQVLFLLVLAWAFEKQDEDFLFIALLAGLFMDFYSGVTAGTFTLPLLVVAMAGRLVAENYLALEWNTKYVAALLLPAQILFDALYWSTSWLYYKTSLLATPPSSQLLLRHFVILFFYNLILLYPVSVVVSFAKLVVSRYFEREYKAK